MDAPAGPQGDGSSEGPPAIYDRRVSGRVLAVSIAGVVLGALGLLTILPGDGSVATGAGTGGTAKAAATAPVGRPAAEPSSWPAPMPAPATSLRPRRPAAAAGRTTVGAGAGSATGTGGSARVADQNTAGWSLVGRVDNRTAPYCARSWTARVHVTVLGVAAYQVIATWFDGSEVQSISLRRRGGDWEGDLFGLPVGTTLWWRAGAATADGAAITTGQQPLRYDCTG